MAFRTSELLQRNELVRFQLDDVIRAPGNGQHQEKNGYRFTNLHKVTFVKNLLEYSDDYSRSVGKNSFWYLDTNDTTANTNLGYESRRVLTQAVNNDGTGGSKDVNLIIPLNRYSFFEELQDKMLVPMQLQFNLNLQNDNELINMAAGVDAGRVVLNRFLLWVPKLTPKDSMYNKFVSSFMKEHKWTYQRELYAVSAPARVSGFFRFLPVLTMSKQFLFIYNGLKPELQHKIHIYLIPSN